MWENRFKMKRLIFILLISTFSTVWAADDLRLKVAAEYEKKGEFGKALEEYRALLVEKPKDFDAQLRAGNLQLRTKKYESAASYYKGALAVNPKSPLALQGMAQAQEKKGAPEQSVLFWRKLADLSGGKFKTSAEREIARILQQKKSSKNSTKASTPTKPNDSKYSYDGPLFKKGVNLHNAKKNKEALGVWRQVLKAQPGNPGAFYFAGVNRYNLGEFKKAIINFNKGFAYPDKGFNGHYYLGRIYEKQKKNDLAKKHYKQYLKHTKSAQGKKEVQKRILDLGGVVPAVASTSKDSAVKTDSLSKVEKPKKVDGFKVEPMNKGQLWVLIKGDQPGADLIRNAFKKYRDGKMTEAVDRLKSAMVKYPNSKSQKAAFHNYIAMLNELGLDKEAVKQAKIALAKKPGEPFRSSAKFILAKSYFNLSEIDLSLKALKGAISDGDLGPTKADLVAFESTLSRSSKKEKQGVQKLRIALESEKDPIRKMELELELAKGLAPTSVSESIDILKKLSEKCLNQNEKICRKSKLNLADILFKEGKYKDAGFYYKKMISENPDDKDTPWAKYQIGNVLIKLKNPKEAISKFNELIEKHPKSYWAQQAIWKRDDTIWRQQYKETAEAK